MSPAERDGSSPGMGGLERAAAILGAFDATHRELSLAALVARSGLPRSTAHRTADKMLRLGWLDKPEDRYRIGNRLFEVSGLAPIRHLRDERVNILFVGRSEKRKGLGYLLRGYEFMKQRVIPTMAIRARSWRDSPSSAR